MTDREELIGQLENLKTWLISYDKNDDASEITEAIALLRADSKQAVAVKPLDDWPSFDPSAYRGAFSGRTCHTIVGRYDAIEYAGWLLFLTGQRVGSSFVDLEAAQAAAQTDFEQRIRSTLAPAPQPAFLGGAGTTFYPAPQQDMERAVDEFCAKFYDLCVFIPGDKSRTAVRTAFLASAPFLRVPDGDLASVKRAIDIRMDDYLCEMKPDYDDSITGFNEAWKIVDNVFEERATLAAVQPKEQSR